MAQHDSGLDAYQEPTWNISESRIPHASKGLQLLGQPNSSIDDILTGHHDVFTPSKFYSVDQSSQAMGYSTRSLLCYADVDIHHNVHLPAYISLPESSTVRACLLVLLDVGGNHLDGQHEGYCSLDGSQESDGHVLVHCD